MWLDVPVVGMTCKDKMGGFKQIQEAKVQKDLTMLSGAVFLLEMLPLLLPLIYASTH